MPELETFNAHQILLAIDQFLEYGERSYVEQKGPGEPGQCGYFSGQGWAARCLRYHREQVEQMKTALERTATLELALSEAMSVRHFCDMEQQPEPDDPYRYDVYLQKWAKALGRKVESNWPHPGIKD